MTARDRRALVLGAATIAGAFVALRAVPPLIRAGLKWRSRVAEEQATLLRERDLVSALPALRDSLNWALASVVALAPRLVAVGTPAEASASLASVVSLAAGRNALKVLRVDPLPDSVAGVFTRVAVHAELEGDVRGLVRCLRALETGDPVLTVPTLTVDSPQPMAGKDVAETLHINLVVSGYAMRRTT